MILEISRNDGNHFLNASFAGDAFRVCSVDDRSSSRIQFSKLFDVEEINYLTFELEDSKEV